MNFANKIPVEPDRFLTTQIVFPVTAYSFENEEKKQYHRLFEKQVEIFIEKYEQMIEGGKVVFIEPIVSFGGYCRYYAKDLIKHKDKSWPDFCIDAGGSNHAGDGRAVYVSSKLAVALAEIALAGEIKLPFEIK